jgi:hypothetical protein
MSLLLFLEKGFENQKTPTGIPAPKGVSQLSSTFGSPAIPAP